MFERNHTWKRAFFFSFSISLCICVDIFQHSVPLPFLPQALSAQGHTAMEIASVMGGYYWMGFAGGLLLTLVCFYRVLYGDVRQPTWADMRSHVWKLILGLTCGSCTLLAEAANPNWLPDITVHLYCRLLQGFIGAFLFFYSYLLSVKLFTGTQQVFALTLASIALNVAEVFGPVLGACIYTTYGPSAPYIFLGILSGINNVLLFITVRMLPGSEAELPADEEEQRRLVSTTTPHSFEERKATLGKVFVDLHLWRAVLVIAPAAAEKSCFESILPFFGDQHHYSEIHIGWLFMVVAIAYIVASITIGYAWISMSEGYRLVVITVALGALACSAGSILNSFGTNWRLTEFGFIDITRHEAFYLLLITYGLSLGLTHTPAAFLLGVAIDKHEDAALQDAVNGVYNTMWELGGSLGFVLSGMASQHDWRQEQQILAMAGSMVGVATVLFVLTSEPMSKRIDGFLTPPQSKMIPT